MSEMGPCADSPLLSDACADKSLGYEDVGKAKSQDDVALFYKTAVEAGVKSTRGSRCRREKSAKRTIRQYGALLSVFWRDRWVIASRLVAVR